jgi:hypothetical protein
MKTTNPIDAARIELLLSDLRLPAVNRRTASALGIEVPLGLLLAADEVIE